MFNFLKKQYSLHNIPVKIWALFSGFITIVPFIFYLTGLSSNLPFSIRTYILDFWAYFWDGSHYIFISQFGYKFPLQAFFPGYPLILKALDLFLPLSIAVRVNYLVVFLMIIFLYKFMDIFNFSTSEKIRALVLYLAYPTSFFFIANYTEALYILLATLILIFLNQSSYKKAAITSFFISTIKISSIIFPLLISIRYLKENYKSLNFKKLTELGLLNLLSVFGIILYFLYLQIYQKGFGIYFKAQSEWGRGSFSFISSYANLQSEFYFERISEILVFALLIGVFIWAYKKINSELYFFSIYHFLLPVLTGTLLSLTRLSLYCFPVLLYFFGKTSKNKIVFYLMFIVLLIWQLIGIHGFINGNFVG